MYLKFTSFKSGGHTLGSALGHYWTAIKNEQENELSPLPVRPAERLTLDGPRWSNNANADQSFLSSSGSVG